MKKMSIKKLNILAIGCMVLTLSGCESAKEQLGMNRHAPDEFAVLQRAPLELPPDYSLRPPQPGAPRPQEQTVSSDQPRTLVFGNAQESTTIPASGESALLNQAGAGVIEPGIRETVDHETNTQKPKDKSVSEKIFGFGFGDDDKKAASVVDPKAEAERIRKNQEEGAPVTKGETPTIEQ